MSKTALSAVLLSLLGACGQPSNIPCNTDDNCPTGWFCKSSLTCAQRTSTSSPSDIELTGVAATEGGPFGSSVSIATGAMDESFFMQLTNKGTDSTLNVKVAFSGSSCITFSLDSTIPFFPGSSPATVQVDVGTNDCTARVTRAEARRIHSDMIDAIFAPAYASDPDTTPLLITSTLLPRRGNDPAAQQCTLYFNEEIRDLARTHPRSASIALADMNNGTFITVDDLAPGDTLHPSAEGYAKMAAVWYEALNANLDKLRAPIAL